LLAAVCYFWAYYGIIYWAPMLTNAVLGKELTAKNSSVTTVLLTAIPYGCAAVWQVGRMCDSSLLQGSSSSW
jgi:hypothetical protein